MDGVALVGFQNGRPVQQLDFQRVVSWQKGANVPFDLEPDSSLDTERNAD
jgi:hypothetical protein